MSQLKFDLTLFKSLLHLEVTLIFTLQGFPKTITRSTSTPSQIPQCNIALFSIFLWFTGIWTDQSLFKRTWIAFTGIWTDQSAFKLMNREVIHVRLKKLWSVHIHMNHRNIENNYKQMTCFAKIVILTPWETILIN